MFEILKLNLEERGFQVSDFSTAEEAADYLNGQIDAQTVAFGGSTTLKEMGLYDSLGAHNTVYWHDKASSPEEREDIFKKAMGTTFYLSSVNGLAETGEIINIDATCNRVSSTLFGHEKVYLIVGKNKIAANYDDALYRARNIAAPKNAQRLGRKTPCAVKADHCYDCKSPDRICCGLTVLWRKPLGCEVEVVLIDQELGY